ncbi:hypothetical protein L4F92_07025 [Avibacterium sp. 21-595]|uniref:hypothetical protein n=1 Tax=Avibacterium sp. 21-595 TaxID=2911527 RepID=UPI0020262CAC|nr:hypothetical protein [Avibacterium sp. 21-595]URL05825.1 hypothetical protein L4F92_07025 [Avibacterium sp. 21-595]
MKILSDEIATNLCTLCIYSNDKDDNKEYIVCSINDWIIIFTIILNIVVMRYFSFYFNIEQLTRFFNPITGILSLSIINVLAALWIIQQNKNITLFISEYQFKYQLMTSMSTALLATAFYIIKPILMSPYDSKIDKAISDLTLNSIQQYPIFRELFYSITIEALSFIYATTIAFMIFFLPIAIAIIVIDIKLSNKENSNDIILNIVYTLFLLFPILYASVSHRYYLEKILKEKILPDKNVNYLLVKYEYDELSKRCNNPKLIKLNQTNQYRFKFISHNKVIYVEGMSDKDINKEERTLENITEYNFYPDEEECIKFE